MIPTELQNILTEDSETLSGAIRFRETRVPVRTLLDYVNYGDSLESFLLGYPAVKREQALAVLSWQDKHIQEVMKQELMA